MVTQCPTCRKQTEWEGNRFRPFCSDRCKLIDLGKWLDEEHRIPGETDEMDTLPEDDDQEP